MVRLGMKAVAHFAENVLALYIHRPLYIVVMCLKLFVELPKYNMKEKKSMYL